MALFPNPIQDSFDLYSSIADASSGPVPVWESSDNWELTDGGRFSGSRCLAPVGNNTTFLTRATGSNDSSVIINFAFLQREALSGTDLGLGVQGLDGTTAQWTILFRSDGSVLLKSGGAGGSTIATLTGVFTQNTWEQFQIEVVTNNTTGSISIWSKGQVGALTSPDFSLGSLNTRGGTANDYINRISIVGGANANGIKQYIDDFYAFNEGGAAPNDLQGDVRCEVLRPNSDSSVQFSIVGENISVPTWADNNPTGVNFSYTAGMTVWIPFHQATASGVLDHITFVPSASDGSVKSKMAIYKDSFLGVSILPGDLIDVCNTEITGLSGPQDYDFTGLNINIIAGNVYWAAIMMDSDETTGLFYPLQNNNQVSGSRTGNLAGGVYPNFPPNGGTADTQHIIGNVASQGVALFLSAPGTNYGAVDDSEEDGDLSYVEDNVLNHVDQYGILPLSSSPDGIVMVVPKMYARKADAGIREAEIEIISNITTHDSPSVAVTSTGGYISDPLTEDPDTSSAWIETGVNSITIGPKVSV